MKRKVKFIPRTKHKLLIRCNLFVSEKHQEAEENKSETTA